jgi:hypothetical protein
LDEDDRHPAQDPPQGQERVGWMFTLTAAAYNLVRLSKLPKLEAV